MGKKIIYENLIGRELDYAKGKNWMVKHDKGEYPVDVFYLYATSVNPKCQEDVAPIDNYMRFNAFNDYERGASLFEDFCNVFVPYYRQISLKGIEKCDEVLDLIEKDYHSEVRTDTYSALDYYFKHFNKGRPYILAGHSQGAAAVLNILRDYMRLHPGYYKRMIAAYPISMGIGMAYKMRYPYVKFAKGEKDLGVIISWNVEAPGATKDNFALNRKPVNVINPLNWKTDGSYAGVELNKGSYDTNTHSIIPGVADAQIDKNRLSLLTTTAEKNGYKTLPDVEGNIFGDKSYHFDDWNFYYMNIQENAKKRINEYFKVHKNDKKNKNSKKKKKK